MSVNLKNVKAMDIAIIGIGVQSPLGDNLEQIWDSLCIKKECTRTIPKNRREKLQKFYNDEKIEYNNFSYLDEIDEFDNEFFRIPPIEAKIMSPVQRKFLECVSKSIQDAGYDGDRIVKSNTGVFVGYVGDLGGETYKNIIVKDNDFDSNLAFPANLPSMLPSRISYLLDLKGPTMLVDTACSSSLSAVHIACNFLRTGECEMAIAGGVKINVTPVKDKNDSFGVESTDCRTRTFDDSADGSGGGEALAAILLKLLSEAEKDGDNIYAVIKGSAMNQDGYGIGITAPNKESQIDVLEQAWENANVNPVSLGYIECHGTATKLGDPIEVSALTAAMDKYTDRKAFCALGSIKSNTGHLVQSAGIFGLLKMVSALKKGVLPPTINFQNPNRIINFEDSAFYVNTKVREWNLGQEPRRAGVSAFGLSGTNCHVVLEEYIDRKDRNKALDNEDYVFTFSALDSLQLFSYLDVFKRFLEVTEEALRDISYTLNTGRQHFNHRIAIIAKSKEELMNKLDFILEKRIQSRKDSIFFNSFKIVKRVDGESLGKVTQANIDNLTMLSIKIIKKYNETKIDSLLNKICDLYVSGGHVKWEQLYSESKFTKVSLPPYVFKRQSFWPKLKDKEHFYNVTWVKNNTEMLEAETSIFNKHVIVFALHADSSEVNLVKRMYKKVTVVQCGKSFKKINDNLYESRACQEDYAEVFRNIEMDKVDEIIHMNALESREIETLDELDEKQENGVLSLFLLVKELNKRILCTDFKLIVFTRCSSKVIPSDEIVYPQNAPIVGLTRVIRKEHAELNCKCIDLNQEVDFEKALLACENNQFEYDEVAYRMGEQFIREFSYTDYENNQKSFKINPEGVYLITGATGGIGMEISKMFAEYSGIKLILTGRTSYQEDLEKTEEQTASYFKKKHRFMMFMKELEQKKVEVEYIQSDVADTDRMREVIHYIIEKYGEINGIVNCAGTPGMGMIMSKEYSDFKEMLQTKVNGTWNLDFLTKKQPLDFFIMCSSVASIFGEVGQADYAASNSYLDSFVDYRNSTKEGTISINWTVWKEVGMGLRFELEKKDLLFEPLATSDALSYFKEIMEYSIPNTIVGCLKLKSKMIGELINTDFRLHDSIRSCIQDIEVGKAPEKKQHGNKNISLSGKGNDYSDVEKEIGKICGRMLGFNELDINDNLFELGADSIHIKRIYEAINEMYPGKLSVADMYAFTTVESLAKQIESKKMDVADKHSTVTEIDDILSGFEEGSINLNDAINMINNS